MGRETDWDPDLDHPDKASCVTIHIFWRAQYPGQNVFNKRISKHITLPVLNRLEVGNDRPHLPCPRVIYINIIDPMSDTQVG